MVAALLSLLACAPAHAQDVESKPVQGEQSTRDAIPGDASARDASAGDAATVGGARDDGSKGDGSDGPLPSDGQHVGPDAIQPWDQRLPELAATYNSGYLLVVVKSSRLLYVAHDGLFLPWVEVTKSNLDQKFFGALASTPDDTVTMRFPVPVAVSDRKEPRTWKWDRKTPEGHYRICNHSHRGKTNYTVALSINFPNLDDLSNALKKGRITRDEFKAQKQRLDAGLCPLPVTYLGGWIRIHGPSDADVIQWREKGVRKCPSHPPVKSECTKISYEEWMKLDNADIGVVVPGRFSKGCMVLELTPLFYLYNTMPVGTPVVILP